MKTKIILLIALAIFNSCSSVDDKVKEYRSLKDQIAILYQKISTGEKDKEEGIAEIAELQNQLITYDQEILDQYEIEERIKKEIEIKKEKEKIIAEEEAKRFKADSIKKVEIEKRKAREEKARLKAEVEEMIRMEEEAEYNLYLSKLSERGFFLVSFDGIDYEVNQKEWDEWKISENYDSEDSLSKYKEMIYAMGQAKANGVANSLFRTLSKGIAKEGLTYKAVQGIQVYNIFTKGHQIYD